MINTAPTITPIVEPDRFDGRKGSIRFGEKAVRYTLTLEEMEQLALDLFELVDELRAEWFADGYVEPR